MSRFPWGSIVAKAVALAAAALLGCAPMAYADPADPNDQTQQEPDQQNNPAAGMPGQDLSLGGQGILVLFDGVPKCTHRGEHFTGVHSIQYLGSC